MLSLKQCRQHLPAKLQSMSDEELERLRDSLAALASVALGSFGQLRSTDSSTSAHHDGKPSRPVPGTQTLEDLVSDIPNPDRELILERAAIIEFDAGLDRQAAEDVALSEWRHRRMTMRTTRIQ